MKFCIIKKFWWIPPVLFFLSISLYAENFGDPGIRLLGLDAGLNFVAAEADLGSIPGGAVTPYGGLNYTHQIVKYVGFQTGLYYHGLSVGEGVSKTLIKSTHVAVPLLVSFYLDSGRIMGTQWIGMGVRPSFLITKSYINSNVDITGDRFNNLLWDFYLAIKLLFPLSDQRQQWLGFYFDFSFPMSDWVDIGSPTGVVFAKPITFGLKLAYAFNL